MEGLEVAEIPYSEFLVDNLYVRLDSEYQAKERKAVVTALRAMGAVRFGDSEPEIIHPHEITRSYVDEGDVWFFRAQNNRPMMIDQRNKVFISDDDALSLPRNKLQNGDIVITRTGANAGDCALFNATGRAVASSHTFIVRSKHWQHSYLVAFFNSRFGQKQIISSRYGAAQPEVAPYYIRNILIPSFSKEFYCEIEKCFGEVESQTTIASKYLANAESTLLHALGLDTWTPPEALSYVRSSRDVFAAGRLDAEYFHPEKLHALAKLQAISDVCVGDLFDSIHDLWQPMGLSVDPIRNYDLTDALSPFLDPLKPKMEPENIASTKKKIAAGDLVVSRLRSYLREIAVVLPSNDGVTTVASTEFIVLRPKKEATLSVEALLIYLCSLLPQIVFKWSQDGSNHPRFAERELLSLPVPRKLLAEQAIYEAAMRQMVEQRQRATRLLDAAKRAVEIAIEENESAALRYLQELY